MSEDNTQGADRDFVEYVVKQLVDNADAVIVERSVDDLGVLITLKVHPDDMGKIIGKSGQTAKALRVLLRVIGSKSDLRVNLKIIEPEGSERSPRESAAPESVQEEALVAEEVPSETETPTIGDDLSMEI